MVARMNDDKELRNRRALAREDKRRETMQRAQDIQRDFLITTLDELAIDFASHPDQIGHYVADLEAAGMLSPADKGMLFRRLWETMGPAFADQAFGMVDRALASDIAGDIADEAYFTKTTALVDSPEELRRVEQASHVLETLARALGLSIAPPRAQLRNNFDDNVHDLDPVRAEKTREILDTLGHQLGIDPYGFDVKVDEEGQEQTGDQGLYGLMHDGTVFLDPEIYDPTTPAGRGLLAHEVVHIAQYENRLRGGNDVPDIGMAETEADSLSSQFAAGGPVQAPLSALASYDKAACGPREMNKDPKDDPKKEDPKEEPKEPTKQVVVVPPVYDIGPGHWDTPSIKVPPIHFQVNKWKMSETMNPAEAKNIVKTVADTIELYPEITKVKVEGFTSTTATIAHNQVLSENRAREIAGVLQKEHSEKVKNVTIEHKGWGEDPSKLIAKDKSGKVDKRQNQEHTENRRTEFNIYGVNGQQPGKKWVPGKMQLKTPGKTIYRYIGPDGKVIKEEVIDNGEATTTEGEGGADAKTTAPAGGAGGGAAGGGGGAAAGGGGAAAGGGGAAAGGGGAAAGGAGSTNEATKKDEEAKKKDQAKKNAPGCGATAAAGPAPGTEGEAPDQEKTPAEGGATPGVGETTNPREQIIFRARISARRLRRLRQRARNSKKKQPRRFAGPVLRHTAQAKAQAGGLVTTEMANAAELAGGEVLPDAIRSHFESAFGQSFADVRIHRASTQASAIGAAAFARGHEIHFAPGRFDTSSEQGMAVLGHELAHIVQQRVGRVAAARAEGHHVNVEHALEAEADLLGARAARGERVDVAGATRVVAPVEEAVASAAAPRTCEVEIGGHTISARLPDGARPGEVTVGLAGTAGPGVALTSARLELDAAMQVVSGELRGAIDLDAEAAGVGVRGDDVRITVDGGRFAGQVNDARVTLPGGVEARVDLRLDERGLTGAATLEVGAERMELAPGVTLSRGELRLVAGEDGEPVARATLAVNAGGVDVDLTIDDGVATAASFGFDYDLPLWKGRLEGAIDPSGSVEAIANAELKLPEVDLGGGARASGINAIVELLDGKPRRVRGRGTFVLPVDGEDTFEIEAEEVEVDLDEGVVGGRATVRTMRDIAVGGRPGSGSYGVRLARGGEIQLLVEGGALAAMAVKNLRAVVAEGADGRVVGDVDLRLDASSGRIDANARLTVEGACPVAVGTRVVTLRDGGKVDVVVVEDALTSLEVDAPYAIEVGGATVGGRLVGRFAPGAEALHGTLHAELEGDLALGSGELVIGRGAIAAATLGARSGEDPTRLPVTIDLGCEARHARDGEALATTRVAAQLRCESGELDLDLGVGLERPIEVARDGHRLVIDAGSRLDARFVASTLEDVLLRGGLAVHDQAGCVATGWLEEGRVDAQAQTLDGRLELQLERDLALGDDVILRRRVNRLGLGLVRGLVTGLGLQLGVGHVEGGEIVAETDVSAALDALTGALDLSAKTGLVRELFVALGGGLGLVVPAGGGAAADVRADLLEAAQIDVEAQLVTDDEVLAETTVEGRYALGEDEGLALDVQTDVFED
ncbi:MAG: DUF4157 domain-containing protein [Deltaproteobacteria bacterium]|nr:DUF4157 domain-containing protein [Deltaproteobacteria bacterium]